MQQPIRVMIVDDQPVVRQGLATFLTAFEDMELVAEASSGDETLATYIHFQPDVVLMDLIMPGTNGVEATRQLHEHDPNARIVVLTSYREDELVQGALQAGALGYHLKNASADTLAEAIRTAYGGRSTLAPEATEALIRAATQPPPPGHDLTDRELEVLTLMVQGLNNREIGEKLFVSPSTAKFHVGNILSKLGADSRAEAVAIAIQNGIVAYES